jgi:LysR family transcriptional activator of nhaA
MSHLNYQHLLYFWTTAREGNLTAASRLLRLSPSTVSAQIRLLEEQLGHTLFDRSHRRMTLTERGQVVARLAEQIFALGDHLVEAMEEPDGGVTAWLRVGVESHLPKLVAASLLRSLVGPEGPTRLLVSEGFPDELADQLAEGRLDLVLTDIPATNHTDRATLQRRLGETSMIWMGTPDLVEPRRERFPHSLDGAPVMLPDRMSTLRADLDDWFASLGVRPRVVAEIGDSALMKALGADGVGLFLVPGLVRTRVAHRYGVQELGEAEGVRQRFYALADPRHSSRWSDLKTFAPDERSFDITS